MNAVDFKIVDGYSSSIIQDLEDCDALMWHHHHGNYKDLIIAKQLIFAVEKGGKIVFPNIDTSYHFDDKLSQKYLFEALGIPCIRTSVFFDFNTAKKSIQRVVFPVVFKLRSGAGGASVQLLRNESETKGKLKKSFSSGFVALNRTGNLRDRYGKYLSGNGTIMDVVKALVRLVVPVKDIHLFPKEKGYFMLQEFLDSNESDTRVVVIENKAFAIKRLVRKNDFRASGSGMILYGKNEIDLRCIKLAMDSSRKLNAQCLAYDFIHDEHNEPKIVEVSFGFSYQSYRNCPGYWDSNLSWIEGEFDPCQWMIEGVIDKIKES
ncbi:hypothetical protein N9W65_03145 [Schleiferiaceae bacterium]|nr:hypothetical protein [Schleiferiaceae bacterium]